MGSALCSTVHKDGDQVPETEDKAHDQITSQNQPRRRLRKMPTAWKPEKTIGPTRSHWRDLAGQNKFNTEQDYVVAREDLINTERSIAFDAEVREDATDLEKRAARVLKRVRDADWDEFYGTKFEVVNGKLTGKRNEGEHFLGMRETINKTRLFNIARKMPKGAHLHIHFNSCLDAKFLIQQARDVDTMYIRSDRPLHLRHEETNKPYLSRQQLDDAIISFNVLTEAKALEANLKIAQDEANKVGAAVPDTPELKDLFAPEYKRWEWMSYKTFQQRWDEQEEDTLPGGHGIDALENWLATKNTYTEEQAHGVTQTGKGVWNAFNFRTQFMKGLFAYESAYRNYTRACIKDFVDDNIQYAEVRPNFMSNNTVWSNDATSNMNNFAIMNLIQEELSNTMEEIKNEGNYFGGMKVIYCHPRVFNNQKQAVALAECLEIKKKFPELLCGFDLVGEEEAGNELRLFSKEFIQFQKDCEKEGVEIPFIFHCGETLESGGKTDGNLYDAILLNSKRIGHGYALARHPLLMDIFKKKGMAIEACPISNEVLGLTPVIAGHHLHQFLANDVPCTINSDNGTLFKSTLSHDFYQAMIGSENMSLFSWKQLALWSLEHSCMEPDLKQQVTAVWQQKWDEFCQWIVDTYDTPEYAGPVDTKPRRPGYPWP